MASHRTKTRRPETQFDLAGVGLHRDKSVQNESKPREISQSVPYPSPLKKLYNTASTQPSVIEKLVVSPEQNLPWRSYKKLYALQFGDSPYFPIGEKTTITTGKTSMVIVKTIAGSKQSPSMKLIQSITHDRFVQVVDIFATEECCSIAFEFLPISLAEFMGNPLMSELRLAAILSQVNAPFSISLSNGLANESQIMEGLAFLEKNFLCHTRLSCSNVLVDSDGNVKICESLVEN